MRKRIHASLDYLTPAEFEQQWQEQERARELCQQAEIEVTNSQS